MGCTQQWVEFAPARNISPEVDLACWYAIQTRARHEKRVESELQSKGVTTFLPLLSQVHRWSDRCKCIEVPLFSCYAFVRIIPSPEIMHSVLATPGVLSLVGAQGRGFPVPDKEIEDVRKLLTQGISFTYYPFLRVGQRVRVRDGCLAGIEGILVTQKANCSLVVSINVLNRSISIQISGFEIEPVF